MAGEYFDDRLPTSNPTSVNPMPISGASICADGWMRDFGAFCPGSHDGRVKSPFGWMSCKSSKIPAVGMSFQNRFVGFPKEYPDEKESSLGFKPTNRSRRGSSWSACPVSDEGRSFSLLLEKTNDEGDSSQTDGWGHGERKKERRRNKQPKKENALS